MLWRNMKAGIKKEKKGRPVLSACLCGVALENKDFVVVIDITAVDHSNEEVAGDVNIQGNIALVAVRYVGHDEISVLVIDVKVKVGGAVTADGDNSGLIGLESDRPVMGAT